MIEEHTPIRLLAEKYGIRPTKKFGQNFFVDAHFAKLMCDAAELSKGDAVVEVGPGLGALTSEIAARVKKVLAIEVDKGAVFALHEILGSQKNVEVVEGDARKFSNKQVVDMLQDAPSPQPSPTRGEGVKGNPPPFMGGVRGGSYKVVASLPYNITSPMLRKFTEYEPRPSLIVVMVQKEVAERVCAKPGEMSILSVAIQYYGKPEIVAMVPRTAFWPEPNVDSAILKIKVPKAHPPTGGVPEVPDEFEKRLFQLVRIGFSARRKQLQNNLSAGLKLSRETVVLALEQAGLSSTVRPQELSVENWIALTRLL